MEKLSVWNDTVLALSFSQSADAIAAEVVNAGNSVTIHATGNLHAGINNNTLHQAESWYSGLVLASVFSN